MTDWQAITTKTYDDSADDLAEFYKDIGPRTMEIELAFKLIGHKQAAKVIEIGCGDGRDAVEITEKTQDYEGFDPSVGMIQLAKEKLPEASFVISDALSYDYPKNVDIMFAFASLLHVNRGDLEKVFKLVADSVASDGIFYISLKESQSYREEVQKDQFGERMFYYYSAEDVIAASGDAFELVSELHQTIGGTTWLKLGLRRR